MRVARRSRNNSLSRSSQPPANQQRPAEQLETVLVHSKQELWQGPLPSPKTMEQYRDLSADWPDRIIRQWETESDHRRTYEMTALTATARRDFLGQIFAGAFALGALAVAAFALWMGLPWVAAILGGGTIASVVGAFLYRSHTK